MTLTLPVFGVLAALTHRAGRSPSGSGSPSIGVVATVAVDRRAVVDPAQRAVGPQGRRARQPDAVAGQPPAGEPAGCRGHGHRPARQHQGRASSGAGAG